MYKVSKQIEYLTKKCFVFGEAQSIKHYFMTVIVNYFLNCIKDVKIQNNNYLVCCLDNAEQIAQLNAVISPEMNSKIAYITNKNELYYEYMTVYTNYFSIKDLEKDLAKKENFTIKNG